MTSQDRQRELAMIHIAKKQLGMDDETYRALLWTLCRTHSAADLDAAGRERVIRHMRLLGFRPRRRGRTRPPADKHDLVAKIRALLGDRPEQYADGIARRMYGVERYEWCTHEQLRGIIAALNYDRRRREGYPKQ